MWGDDFRLGVVDALQAKAAAVVARNPHLAKRILGPYHKPQKKQPELPPVQLAKPPKESGKTGPATKYPWAALEINEYFDVDMSAGTRKLMVTLARQAYHRSGRRYGVQRTVNAAGRGVIRVRRVA